MGLTRLIIHTIMLHGIKYIASEGCDLQFGFEEWAVSPCVAMCRGDMELAGAAIYP